VGKTFKNRMIRDYVSFLSGLTRIKIPSTINAILRDEQGSSALTKDSNNILSIDLTSAMAQRVLKEIALDSTRVKVTNHAEESMIRRNISCPQVFSCLRNGRITEGPYRDIHGNWKMNIEVFTAGEPLTVNNNTIIKLHYWECRYVYN